MYGKLPKGLRAVPVLADTSSSTPEEKISSSTFGPDDAGSLIPGGKQLYEANSM
jgi:hypothetical protein